MKTFLIFRTFITLVLLGISWSCTKTDSAPTTPDYQTAIEAKYKALGWDKDGHALLNGTGPVKTVGGKGYVQYYAFGTRQTAIYYFDGKGAFSMDTEEMKAYDKAGQDNWGLVVSDQKGTKTGGCGYNDIITTDGKEAIITCQNLVYGEVYKKYKDLNRWDGPLGLPTASILVTPANATDKGVFGSFQNGTIWHTPTVGAVALWGKVLKLYAAIDYERSWLKYPTESCDPNKGDANQSVAFERGKIGVSANGCGNYYSPAGGLRDKDNKVAASGSSLCY